MCNYKCGTVLCKFFQRILHHFLALIVKCGGCLIKNKDRWIFKENRMRQERKSSRQQKTPMRMSLSCHFQTVMRRTSDSAGSSFPADRSSDCPLQGFSLKIHRSLFLMRQPPHLSMRARKWCRILWKNLQRTVPHL